MPDRVLAVYAHPDDADVSAGGTLATWAEAGAHIEVVVCAMGDKGAVDPSTDAAELAQRRADEVGAAADALGIDGVHLLGRPDGEVVNDASLRGEIVGLIRSVRPDTVVCPDPTAIVFGASYVNHRDHREVGWATLDASSHEAGNALYFPDAGPPHRVSEIWLSGTLEPDAWVDIEAALDRKAKALACHESQLGEAGEWLRAVVQERARDAGRASGHRYAEGFRRLVLP
ncbi:MAG TPA: PIG-L deacetylase family protein [Acidimicrobiales bacterium]|jgi:LmbE family N-acetylglucosaminyl deacetylase|nr:PIG-L deacetylase family protein [Acidimicrobiales bacterium]